MRTITRALLAVLVLATSATAETKPKPNLSILDGWWPEGCEHGKTGWKIGDADPKDDAFDAKDMARVDKRDRELLFKTLEKDVLPAFENRAKWVSIMRASIAMSQWRFSSDRMIEDYIAKVYSGR